MAVHEHGMSPVTIADVGEDGYCDLCRPNTPEGAAQPECKTCGRTIKAQCADCLLGGIRKRIHRVAVDALRATLNDHGTITPNEIGSAAKRVSSRICAQIKQAHPESTPPEGPWDHHDGSRSNLAPSHGFTPLEVFSFHAVLGEARREFKNTRFRPHVEKVINALERFEVWCAEPSDKDALNALPGEAGVPTEGT